MQLSSGIVGGKESQRRVVDIWRTGWRVEDDVVLRLSGGRQEGGVGLHSEGLARAAV